MNEVVGYVVTEYKRVPVYRHQQGGYAVGWPQEWIRPEDIRAFHTLEEATVWCASVLGEEEVTYVPSTLSNNPIGYFIAGPHIIPVRPATDDRFGPVVVGDVGSRMFPPEHFPSVEAARSAILDRGWDAIFTTEDKDEIVKSCGEWYD